MSNYRAWAATYDLIYDALGKDYAAEAALIVQIVAARQPDARSLLDVACGTGRHLGFWRERFEVEGVDASPEMLAIARRRLPGVPLHRADFRDFDLGRTFDVVTCLFGAIGYVRGEEELREAVRCMARHVAAGGLLLIEGWIAPADVDTEHSAQLVVAESGARRVVRAAASRVESGALVVDFHFLVLDGGRVEYFTDRHRLHLFTEQQYRDAFGTAALSVDVLQTPPWERRLYLGTR